MYFIRKTGSKQFFAKINIDDIGIHTSFDMDDDNVSILSEHYSAICGIDKKLGVIFLTAKDLSGMFVEYYYRTDIEKVNHMKLVGVNSSVPIVITPDGYLSLKFGDVLQYVKKASNIETYEIHNGYFVVEPALETPCMYKPYVLTWEGERKECSYDKCASFLWESMGAGLTEPFGSEDRFKSRKEHLSYIPDVPQISVNGIQSKMENSFCGNVESWVEPVFRFYSFIKMLVKYIDKDKDILDILYIFMDYDRKWSPFVGGPFLTKGLYDEIEKLDAEPEGLAPYLEDLSKLKGALDKNVYWTEDKIAQYTDKKQGIYVGTFYSDNGQIVSIVKHADDAICIGRQLMLPFSECIYEGLVIYNMLDKYYIIQYSSELSEEEIEQIELAYHMGSVCYDIIVEQRSTH